MASIIPDNKVNIFIIQAYVAPFPNAVYTISRMKPYKAITLYEQTALPPMMKYNLLSFL